MIHIRSFCLASASRGHYRYPTAALHGNIAFRSAKSLSSPLRQITARLQSTSVAHQESPTPEPSRQHHTLALPSEARFNEIGVQQLSSYIYPQIFPKAPASSTNPDLVELSKEHLLRHELLGKNAENPPPIAFDLPKLQGESLDEHFYRLGINAAEPYLSLSQRLAESVLPERPREWKRQSGWTKYSKGVSERVDYPDSDMLVFDVEVLYKESPFAVLAVAAGPDAWYAWISPWLLAESESPCHLVPLGGEQRAKVVVGHNIGYDRARVREEYNILQTKTFYLDTMAMHVAVNGMCSQQRPTWIKYKKKREIKEQISNSVSQEEVERLNRDLQLLEAEDELWVGRSSINSLRDVAKFHCHITLDKEVRNFFGELDREGVVKRLGQLMDYCALDVEVTHRVYNKVFPAFRELCPHPVSFAALRHLSTLVLPVTKEWESYIKNAEETYERMLEGVQKTLVELTEKALEFKDKPEIYNKDLWLRQLDWSGQEIKLKKDGTPAKNQKLPGKPKWYKDLFTKADSDIKVTVRTRIAPIMFKLTWEGYPLVWSTKYGWMFRVPKKDREKFANRNVVTCNLEDDEDPKLRDDREAVYYKIPHKEGPTARCTNPLAKSYLQAFESGQLGSEYPEARQALEMNAMCSYWISARERIKQQIVLYESDVNIGVTSGNNGPELGLILPQVIPMGTITRRAVEATWLTASNAKKNRLGSELKSMVKAPPGYSIVGADVDSQELWIASLMGDAQFKLHGGNALGFMTLEGTKAAGTDLHSKTANILGISRDNAKVFNYGRIYGAGVNYATTLLRQFNPTISEEEAQKVATTLYSETKGRKARRQVLNDGKSFWRGGTESFVFNKLEEFADQEKPRTPVLGAGITEALTKAVLGGGNNFMTSRVNWAIQSSGVDYLHMLIVGMDYLIRRYRIQARLALTVHDEIRYLVKSEDRYRAAMALQVANIWTRAMFSEQMGVADLPQSCAFFSAIDIDHVLRKEVDMDCITPSQPNKIPPGESVDIVKLLEKGEEARLDPAVEAEEKIDLSSIEYQPRPSVMSMMKESTVDFIKAQIAKSDDELKEVIKGITKYLKQKSPSRPKPPKDSFAADMEDDGDKVKYDPRASPVVLHEYDLPKGVTFSEYHKRKKDMASKRPTYYKRAVAGKASTRSNSSLLSKASTADEISILRALEH